MRTTMLSTTAITMLLFSLPALASAQDDLLDVQPASEAPDPLDRWEIGAWDHFELSMGFIAGQRRFDHAAFGLESESSVPGANELAEPFQEAPFDRLTTLGLRYDARLVAAYTRMTVGLDIPFSHYRPTDAQGTYVMSALVRALDDARDGGERVVLLSGEPGVGKTRLLEELRVHAADAGATVMEGRAYEAETGRPYGPFIDGLRALRTEAPLDAALAPLLPEAGELRREERSRERLFQAVVDLVGERARHAGPVLIAVDDVQWLDEASAELLHYLARRSRGERVLIVLTTREGELADNAAMLRVLRGLRREVGIEEIALRGLSEEATAELVRQVRPDLDARTVYETTAGNPLFALEMARSPSRDGVPASVGELVRDRLDRLPAEAADLLRWCAVLGPAFAVERIARVTSLDGAALVDTLETLERHALVRSGTAAGTYAFAHDVVRRSVYAELSDPRRRLMHRSIAQSLDGLEDPDGSIAAELAHHAALASEPALGAAACVRAARRCALLFAYADALALVRRGRRMAESLPPRERVQHEIELMEVSLRARRPDDGEAAAREAEALAERALELGATEHARLGFHMLSHLRWEDGDWSGAQRYTLEAEKVSRAADGAQRALALAEAGRCLAMLERDLGQAEALVREADAIARQLGTEPQAIPAATGMLRLHRGELDEARGMFEQARSLARRDGDREVEFQALEHLVMLELQQEELDRAARVAEELVALGDKMREGSEAPFARALQALVRYAGGDATAREPLDEALEALRIADAKHRLGYALTQAALVELGRGELDLAERRAEEALSLATVLERPSDIARARVALARVADARGDRERAEDHRASLRPDTLRGVAADVRAAAEELAR